MIKVREPVVTRPSVVRTAPLIPRSERPFAALDAALLLMIDHHAGKPCPTRRTIREYTGMPRRKVWAYLEGMQARGLIEMEVVAPNKPSDPSCWAIGEGSPRRTGGGGDPVRRRMRKAGGIWTEWTARSRHDGNRDRSRVDAPA